MAWFRRRKWRRTSQSNTFEITPCREEVEILVLCTDGRPLFRIAMPWDFAWDVGAEIVRMAERYAPEAVERVREGAR